MLRRWCEYAHPVYPKHEGKVTVVEHPSSTCTLTGRVCLCEVDWPHCVRREYALAYQAKHPEIKT
jgi:hypothetical protein